VQASLAATTGVETSDDVAKYLLAGADVVMTATALLRHGPEHATALLDGLADWMARKGFAAVDELRGMLAVPADTDQALYEPAGYVGALREANSGIYSPGEQAAGV
jgi:dihydroorotate dehydrogenase (fumarate)